ncbi:MAG: M23 family metallopeptidase [Bdellovibrionota bacterium]
MRVRLLALIVALLSPGAVPCAGQLVPAADTDRFAIVFPLIAPRVSSGFGERIHPIRRFTRQHQGVDLAAPENSHVRAILAGTVVFAGEHSGYGKLVTIEHGKGYASLYAHLSEIKVQVGQKIRAGTLIGRVGSTGLATGPHLHFEWRKEGTAMDPLKVFPALADVSAG